MKTLSGAAAAMAVLAVVAANPAAAQDDVRVNPQTPDERKVFFGDLHIHTTYSNDAFGLNNNRTPDVAYRYAKGEAVPGYGDETIQLRTPLDFLAVTDHAEYLGIFHAMAQPGHPLHDTELGQLAVSTDNETRSAAFRAFIRALRTGEFPEGFHDPANTLSVWGKIVETAERHYVPGEFTTFAGYEWTSSIEGGNMHRNVIFDTTANPGSMSLPFPTIPMSATAGCSR